MKNLEKKFGSFQLAKRKTPFFPGLLDQYVWEMMNGNQLLGNKTANGNHFAKSYGSNGKGSQNGASVDSMLNSMDPSKNSPFSQTEDDCIMVDLISSDEYEAPDSPENLTFEEGSAEHKETGQEPNEKEPTEEEPTEVEQTKQDHDQDLMDHEPRSNLMDHEPREQATMVVNNEERSNLWPAQFKSPLHANGSEANLKRAESSQTNDDRIVKKAKFSSDKTSKELAQSVYVGGFDRSENSSSQTSAADSTDELNVERSLTENETTTNSKTVDVESTHKNINTVDTESAWKTITELQNQLKDALKCANANCEEANAKLQEAAVNQKQAEAKFEEEIKSLNGKITHLMTKIAGMRKEKEDEVEKAVEDTKKHCEVQYTKLIVEAKQKVCCISCGAEKDQIIACNNECFRNYW